MPASPRERWLWVGATGMLAGAVRRQARPGREFVLVARDAKRLATLTREVEARGTKVVRLPFDYRDADRLRGALAESTARGGPFSTAVCWIHQGAAPDAHRVVAETLAAAIPAGSRAPRYFAVLGSAEADPSRQAARFSLLAVDLRKIALGFIVERGRSRWLTNDEISDGVADAIERDSASTIVGTVEPWTSRP